MQLRGDEGDVGEIQYLGSMWQGEGPELGGGAQEVDEAAAGLGGDLGAVGDAEEVVLPEVAELGVEVAAGGDDERLDLVARQPHDHGVARGNLARGGPHLGEGERRKLFGPEDGSAKYLVTFLFGRPAHCCPQRLQCPQWANRCQRRLCVRSTLSRI